MPSPLIPGPLWSGGDYDPTYIGQRLRLIRCINCTAVDGPCDRTTVNTAFPFHRERVACLDLLLRAEHLLSEHGPVRRTTHGLISEGADGTGTRWVRVTSDRDSDPMFALIMGRPGGAVSLSITPYSGKWVADPHTTRML